MEQIKHSATEPYSDPRMFDHVYRAINPTIVRWWEEKNLDPGVTLEKVRAAYQKELKDVRFMMLWCILVFIVATAASIVVGHVYDWQPGVIGGVSALFAFDVVIMRGAYLSYRRLRLVRMSECMEHLNKFMAFKQTHDTLGDDLLYGKHSLAELKDVAYNRLGFMVLRVVMAEKTLEEYVAGTSKKKIKAKDIHTLSGDVLKRRDEYDRFLQQAMSLDLAKASDTDAFFRKAEIMIH